MTEETVSPTTQEEVESSSSSEYSEKENAEPSNQHTIKEPSAPNGSCRRHSLTHQPSNLSATEKEYPASYSHAPAVTSPSSQLKNLYNLALKNKPLPTNNVLILNDLIDMLFEERKQRDSKGDFEGSVMIMRVIDHVKEYHQIAEKKEFQRRQQNEVRKENNIVQSRIAKFDMETKNLEKNLKKNIAKSRERLIQELKKQSEEQERYWQSEEHMRLYNRPSNQLRALHHQANQMVACARFRDAEEVLKLANKLQQQEQKQGAYQMQTDYENSIKLFNQKVIEELQTFDQDAVNQIQSLRARRATMRTVFQNQEKKVGQHEELAKDCDRCWNANLRSIVNEKIEKSLQNPEEMLCTTRSLGKTYREKQDHIVLSLPKLHSKKVNTNPIPTPDYL